MDEPLIRFADGGRHVDPKSGIARFGPFSLNDPGRHPRLVKVGFIGSAELVEAAAQWLAGRAQGVDGDAANPEFPGFVPERGYASALTFADGWNVVLSQTEQAAVTGIRSQRERFDAALALIDD